MSKFFSGSNSFPMSPQGYALEQTLQWVGAILMVLLAVYMVRRMKGD